MSSSRTVKYLLSEDDLPRYWYNIQADLPQPAPPPLDPGTGHPLDPAALEPLFAKALIEQELTRERDIPIPEEVRDVLRQWRPAPLYRARRLEAALDTPAKICNSQRGRSPKL